LTRVSGSRRSRYRGVATNLAALLLLTIAAGAISVALGQDGNWDLQNYHFYNAWAFMHDRVGKDLAPAQAQSFYPPFLDLPFHAMVAAHWAPRNISFAMGMIGGVGAFFLWKIVACLFVDIPSPTRWLYVALAWLVGITASGPVSLLGSTMNEWQGATLVMIALWLLVRRPVTNSSADGGVIGAGLLCGAASALKLTAATYPVGLFAALLVQRPILPNGLRKALLFAISTLLALGLLIGPWMWMLYTRYANPVFPYFNNLFRSPWWDEMGVPRIYGPHSALQWMSFPLHFARYEQGFVSEVLFSDCRLSIVYVLGALTLGVHILAALTEWRIQSWLSDASRSHWRFVLTFWTVSFVCWAALHSVYRYLIPLELLSGALIAYFLRSILSRRFAPLALVATTGVAIFTVQYPDWWRIPHGSEYFEVHVPALAPAPMILLANDAPMAYVLPFLPSEARFVGINSNFNDPDRHNLFASEVGRAVAEHTGTFYSLSFPHGQGGDALRMHNLQRIPSSCTDITTNMHTSPIELCKLQRMTASGQ
jgi:hypothetical protein